MKYGKSKEETVLEKVRSLSGFDSVFPMRLT
jgi:hypothetical protein